MSDGEPCRGADLADPVLEDLAVHQAGQVGRGVLVVVFEMDADYPSSQLVEEPGVDQDVSWDLDSVVVLPAVPT